MKSQTKDRIKLSLLLFICILIVYYLTFGARNIIHGTMGSKVVDAEDNKEIALLEERGENYAVKFQEDSKYYLQFFNSKAEPQGKYRLTKRQYDLIKPNDYYWYTIKYHRHDEKTGVVESVYTYNPSTR